ncbi:hypothetical protein [Paraburkholderia sp. JPY419]|uniref:hypothetical protein n=1 Tax=Paraburkholderia sp. JPY419 TaxID=667660 RepID=UPI003D1FFDED
MQSTVSHALRVGRLTLLPDGGIDPAHLNKQWRSQSIYAKASSTNTLSADAPPAKKKGRPLKRPVVEGIAKTASEDARIKLQKETALANLRELEYQQRAGLLIEIDHAKRVFFELARGERDAWLAWPSRIAPRLAAHLGIEPDALLRALTHLVHEQLAQLGEPELDFVSSGREP